MKTVKINKKLSVSKIALGCMKIHNLKDYEIEKLILASLELGINFFDHSDIYGDTKCESLFGEVLKKHPDIREKMFIQTKVGIIKGKRYDFSKEHILSTVNEQLKRLNTTYVDSLLLHRPDALVDYNEVNAAFKILKKEGKVRNFGVSNMNSFQMALYQSKVKYPLFANQVELSISQSRLVDEGTYVNREDDLSISRSNGILEYAYSKDVLIQTWGSIRGASGDGSFIDNPKYPELNQKLEELSKKYKVPKNAVAVSWLLKFPQKLQVIVGTTSVVHLTEMAKSIDVELTKDEWYSLYLTSKVLP
ncbi:MAG: aldo/keto reductase [Acholeplasmatales bacterium]|jgi:predicted oxidoreductase|nr:aldo/keto reductase [Acholeplasmatales bacterium]